QNQTFTGSYNVGNDNRIILSLTTAGSAPQTFTMRAALGVLNSGGVATKGSLIEFDLPSPTGTSLIGSRIIEMQDPNAFQLQGLGGSFVYRESGEDFNRNHTARIGQVVISPNGTSASVAGFADINKAGVVTPNVPLTGTLTFPGNGSGRGSMTLTLQTTPPEVDDYVFYDVRANRFYMEIVDPRTASNPNVLLASGVAQRQRVLQFSNAWLNGPAVFHLSGVQADHLSQDVNIGIFTGNGAGSATVLSDENNGGVVKTNNPSTATYSVASNGHTTITAGPTDHPPNLYLYDL